MLVLDQSLQPVDKVASFVVKRVERQRMTTLIYLLGKLVAYLPHNQRAYYAWSLILTFRPAQHLSVSQFSPAHARLILFSRWEIGVILGSWWLGLRMGQPLLWVKRLQAI